MKHLEVAQAMLDNEYVKVAGQNVVFTIQDGPINEVGVNGCQAVDVLEFCGHLFKSLNEAYPCKENVQTMESIVEAIAAQDLRTADRTKRGVEGYNKS